MTPTRQPFGTLPSGEVVEIITLAQPSGVQARILTWGGTLHSLSIPDAGGAIENCVLGHGDLHGYLATRSFFGATIGRFGNRIARGRFTVDGQDFSVPANDGPNALHGGPEGFDRRNWTVVEIGADPNPFVTLELVSPDGDQGFPGNLTVRVTWRLDAAGLDIGMTADCDRACPVSLTNHAFFNLGGGLADPVRIKSAMDHTLTVPASLYLPVDADGIPEGPALPVDGTVFDFRAARIVGRSVRADDAQLLRRRGYDHCLCPDGEGFRHMAQLRNPQSGRRLSVWSDQPGLQFYSGNFLDGRNVGRGGVAYRAGDAICLEPQGFPDAPNRPDFPQSMAAPGAPYRHRMRFDFT